MVDLVLIEQMSKKESFKVLLFLFPFFLEVSTYSINCTLPAVQGLCKANLQRFFYNTTSSQCEKFIYGGCGGNANNFYTLNGCFKECNSTYPCHLPADPGPCEAFMPSYFFNSSSEKCEKFVYGGCQGSANRFKTKSECWETCPDLCTVPAETGLCKADIPRYYYNVKARRCETFVYGGCGGNANRFETESDCLATCSGNANFGSFLIGMVILTYQFH